MLRSCRIEFLPLLPLLLGSCAGSTDLQNPNSPSEPGSGPQADLSPGPIEAPIALRLDSLLEMRVGVRNRGSGDAGPGWVVRVFLSTDQAIDPSDTQIDQFATTRDLPSGGTDRYLRHKKLDRNIPPGTYYIGSILDVTDLVPEADEGNNRLISPGTLTLLPEPVLASGGE